MGGYGSGKRPAGTRMRHVGDALALPIRAVIRRGLLATTSTEPVELAWAADASGPPAATIMITAEPGEDGCPWIRLAYKAQTDEGMLPVQLVAKLISTLLTYQGLRWWFACPMCGRRSGVLYLPAGERYFACRPCHKLRHARPADARW